MTGTITQRELNRATLARQLLLERADAKPYDAVERLGALQAQSARSPYVALWARLRNFTRDDLHAPIMERRLVKSTLMRSTLHLTSARDYLSFRPALHSSLTASAASMIKNRMLDVDTGHVVETVRSYLQDEPRTFAEIFEFLKREFPGCDERALGYAARLHIPLVQIPVETPWSFKTSPARFGLAEQWIGKAVPDDARPRELVKRCIGAIGPLSVADIANWTGLRGVRPVVDSLDVVRFRSESGKELVDLPDGPRPPADTPAPVRFLPEFDNVVLSGADRSRFMTKDEQKRVFTNNLAYAAVFLVDGRVAGAWRADERKSLVVEPFAPLPRRTREDVEAEAEALAQFLGVKLA